MIDYVYGMNLRDLQYLASVAEHLHFGKAALACHVSQPTLSMQLKKLEETLGVQLFERSNKQVMLTEVGREMAVRARRVLAEAEEMRVLGRAHKNPLVGELKMGVFPTLAPYLLPRLMPQLKKVLPSITMLLVEEKTPEIIARLESGVLDCALLAMPVAGDGLASQHVFDEPFYLAVPAGHALAKHAFISRVDLKYQEMLLLDEGHCLRDQALEVCDTIGIGEAQHFRATSLETLRHMVAAGNAVTLMPELAVNTHDRLVSYIPFKAPSPQRSIGLYWRQTSARTPLFKAIANSVINVT